MTGGTVVTTGPIQQGTWGSDSNNRDMPSLAVDGSGDMTVGYTVTSSSMHPAIRYAGRLYSDPLGTLGQGEQTLINGSGSQEQHLRWQRLHPLGRLQRDDRQPER